MIVENDNGGGFYDKAELRFLGMEQASTDLEKSTCCLPSFWLPMVARFCISTIVYRSLFILSIAMFYPVHL